MLIMKRKKIRIMSLKVRKPSRINLYLGKHRKDLRLNWKQAKRKYPHLRKYSDTDVDGTLNVKDCRPLNPAMDYDRKKFVERVRRTEAKVGRAKRVAGKVLPSLPRKLPKIKTTTDSRPVGRPAGVYKWTSPLTGQKVPATVYYKHQREARRRMRTRFQQARMREQAVMARRGVPPQVTRMRQEARLQRLRPAEVPEETEVPIQRIPIRQYPTQPVQQPRFRVVTDIMTGRQIIKPIPPPERWTQD
jgi:hypothetical protein